jgi:uracil-DNA glycosylase
MKYKIAIVGEAYGESEEFAKRPFIGSAGQELDRQLSDAGILRSDCFITNVFNLRPNKNNIETLFAKKNDPGVIRGLNPLSKGLYLKQEYGSELTRLFTELTEVRPNVTVLLGNTATWALLGSGAISKVRGTAAYSSVLQQLKVLPTYHPAAILRQYDLRHVTILDLMKAKRESEFPELRRPVREVWLEPSLSDMEHFFDKYLKSASHIAFDVETAFEQITCISFAPSTDRVLVVPFLDYRQSGGDYWPTVEDEFEAWAYVQKVLGLPAKKVGQNVLYDTQYLWMKYGIPVRNLCHDTMLLHHSLHPESPKSLAFLGSVYTNEIAWKPLRPRGKNMEKREDE